MKREKVEKSCSVGHKFLKSSDCKTCPVCDGMDFKKKNISDFPVKIGAPALRALINAGIKNLKTLQKYTEKDILKLHGMGKAGIKMLKDEMRIKSLEFKK